MDGPPQKRPRQEPEVSRRAGTLVGPTGDDAPSLPEGRQLGPYTLLGELGRGGMAVVYRARREGLGRDVALKVIRPDQAASLEGLARFRREAQVASALTGHPGIVGVHDVGEADGLLYLAMDLIEGRSLYDLIEDELSSARTAEIVEAAARAVHFAHTRGVLHRDIKPANILVTPAGEVRLTDFGIARTQQVSRDATQLTRAGAVIGSPDYMSPEQATGAPIDARSDVYSLGATLYECLVGTPPFNADSLQSLVKQIVEDDVVPPRVRNPDVPRDLDVIACKCLAKAPDTRYPTAEAFADDLARHRRGEAIAARPAGVWDRLARRVRRNPAPYVAAVVAMLAIGVAGAVVAVRSARERATIETTFATARAILDVAPVQALGLLEAVRQQDAEYPGLDAALTAARDRAAAAERESREAEARLLLAKGDAARARYEAETAGAEADAAWYQTWGFYAAARESLAAGPNAPLHAEASGKLADLAWTRLAAGERAGDAEAAARFLRLVREYGAERYARQLDGAGTLTLDTAPSGATVECLACVDPDGDGRLEEHARGALGTTPLARVPLAMGSYVLVLRKAGFDDVRYPVLIERVEDDHVAQPVRLLPAGALDDEWAYVPAGESILGGDPEVTASGPRRRAPVGAFLLQRREVSMAEYAEFLTDLLAGGGHSDEAVTARCPRDSPRAGHYWRARDGRLGSVDTALADDWPALGISWEDAQAYCGWRTQRDGVRVRLPTADEWERAARGADGRAFPWGDGFDWESVVGGASPVHGGRPQPRAIRSAAADRSPFGVRDLGGSVEEWCDDEEAPGVRAAHGGAWGVHRAGHFRASHRHGDAPDIPTPMRGFRLARDLPPR